MSRRTFVLIELAFLGTILLCDCTAPGVLVIYIQLLTGWASFLSRVAPHIDVDWPSVILASGCLAGLVVGLHFFCAWLYREITTRKAMRDLEFIPYAATLRVWKWKTTFAMVGIVLLLFIAGIAAVGGIHQFVWLRTRQ
jgi:hypothetical protein